MSRLTEGEIERAVTALLPYVQEWGLPINPEDLQAMAVAVLTHARGDTPFADIDAAERRWIRENRKAHAEMLRAMEDAVQARRNAGDRAEPASLSSDELTVMEGRAARAMSGPWRSFVEGRDHWGGDDFIRTGGLDDDCPDLYLSHSYRNREKPVPAPADDQDFIAHARQDVPRLVAEVRRLSTQVRSESGDDR